MVYRDWRRYGSPPRLWGKRYWIVLGALGVWFTPTPVGKTRGQDTLWNADTVHPHACGENYTIRSAKVSAHGSPPRLWGKLVCLTVLMSYCRFTPTPVGKTANNSDIAAPLPVHPHACGENLFVILLFFGVFGSPPRLWGKRSFLPRRPRIQTVHPHACGENEFNRRASHGIAGSPPRLWGKLHSCYGDGFMYRFTPTPVGKTQRLEVTYHG